MYYLLSEFQERWQKQATNELDFEFAGGQTSQTRLRLQAEAVQRSWTKSKNAPLNQPAKIWPFLIDKKSSFQWT